MSFKIKGIHHVEFTVKDLQRSKAFYAKLPGFKVVAEYLNFIMFDAGDFKFGLTDHKQQQTTEKFSEKNIGLDHLAIEVSSREDLDKAILFFDEESIQHSEIEELSNNTYTVVFRDPDNIQLELAYKK